MSDPKRRLASLKEIGQICSQPVPAQKIEQLRNRPEKNPAEKYKEDNAVSEELKKQITELTGIRKCDTVDVRIQKIEGAIDTLRDQSKPLKKSLNSTLFSTDTELLELVAQTTHETLQEIGGSAPIDPLEAGKKVRSALEQARSAVRQYTPNESQWCSEWILDEDMANINGMYNDVYGDSDMLEDHRFASRLGFFERHHREIIRYSQPEPDDDIEPIHVQPSIYPFNADLEFLLQLVDAELVEKQKKIREKVEKGKSKQTSELVKVNDKANNVQSEEVSISNELAHVLKVFKKELKHRNTDIIGYYEFVTNPMSFSRTVENMFYVSYLMRDREMFLIEVNGVPTLKKPKDDHGKKQLTDKCSWHGVTSLSHEQWLRLSKVFKSTIIEPLDG
uniref:Non-structural maintenance of chromosomes element 4 n=2 Tax=Caenorhabditis japonica TaxID=281687 RepID=A0A8R1I986_CAEJA